MLNRKTARLLVGLAGALTILVYGFAAKSRAQGGISITFGNGNSSTWAAGPDYATDVLGDPWDFSNQEDIGLDPLEVIGWRTFSVGGGLAGGQTATNDTTLGLLYRGRWGIISPGKNGRNVPIDPRKYQKLAFRMFDSAGRGDNPQVYWFHYPWADPADPNSASLGAEYGVRLLPGTRSGYQTYIVDLTQSNTAGTPWTGATGIVRGLRIDPNGQNSGQTVYFDWVRLTTNDGDSGSAVQTISWSGGSGGATVDVLDAGGTVVNIASNTGASSATWNYGVLPPGAYTLRVTRGGLTGTRPFTINNPPMVQVTDPDETGGEDYATTVFGNAWDMDSARDVQITGQDGYLPVPANFSGNVMTATNTAGDANITLLNHLNNATPIDTSKYRFLTYRLKVDGPYDLALGSVARWFWGSQQFLNGGTATTTKDIIVWPGMNAYTIDLAQLNTSDDGGLETGGLPEAWTAGAKRHLRIDPHEFGGGHEFHLGAVKLAAMDQVTNGSFTIRWSGSDADGGDPTVTLYVDTDTNSSNGKTQIASGLKMSAGQYFWAASVPAGEYYVYAEANDGVQTYGRYSTGKVRVGSATLTPDPKLAVDGPVNGSAVTQPFTVGGWAIDRGAPTGTGVDLVHVWAYPAGGAAPTFLGAAEYFVRRDEVAAAYGSQFTNSGFRLSAQGLATGSYTIRVSAHSSVTNTFSISQDASITIPTSIPAMAIDTPAANSTVSSPLTVSGWAVDRAAPAGTGTGIDYVDAWAWQIHSPDDGFVGAATFLGRSTNGVVRGDIAGAFGAQFTNSGFSITGNLPPGDYRLVAYAHSVVAGTTNNQSYRDVRVATSALSNPLMSLDGPADGSIVTQPFNTGGWAVDLGATSGTGVDAIHVWAFPIVNGVVGAGQFVDAALLGGTRPDVGAAFGSRFAQSGFNFLMNGLSAGQYYVGVYVHSSVTGTFNQQQFARVTIK